MITIRYGDRYLDISKKTQIGITYQAVRFGELASRFISYTNDFKLDLTYQNKITFNHAQNLKSNSEAAYSVQPTFVYWKGLPILDGVGYLNQSDEVFSLSVYDRIKDFFESIKDLSLQDLEFSGGTVTWNNAYIDSRRAATSDIVTPVINYGQMDTTDPVTLSIGDVYLPSIYYKTIIETIFSNAGFVLAGDILTDEKYTKMIMGYSIDEWPGTSFTRDQIMPDISQTEFIKHFMMTFGLVFKMGDSTGSSRVIAYKIDDLLKDKLNAVDWTSKRDTSKKDKINFGSDYSQINYLLYGEGEADNSVQPFPDGYLQVENEQLEPSGVLYSAPFEQRISNEYSVLDGAEFIAGAFSSPPIWSGTPFPTNYPPTEPFDNSPTPLILLVRDKLTAEPDVEYNGTPRSDYLVGYTDNYQNLGSDFYDTLEWQDYREDSPTSLPDSKSLISTYYKGIQESLTKAKTVERFYYLTIDDIINLDLFKLVYDNGDYFLIDKIDKFVPEKITRVTLFKVF